MNLNHEEMNLENKIKHDNMAVEKEFDNETIDEVWSNQERETSKSLYGCEILHERCKKEDSKNNQLPSDSYLITYTIDESTCYDIVRTSKQVNVFDMYYDKFKDSLQSIEWTNGRISPRLWGYKPPQTKKRK